MASNEILRSVKFISRAAGAVSVASVGFIGTELVSNPTVSAIEQPVNPNVVNVSNPWDNAVEINGVTHDLIDVQTGRICRGTLHVRNLSQVRSFRIRVEAENGTSVSQVADRADRTTPDGKITIFPAVQGPCTTKDTVLAKFFDEAHPNEIQRVEIPSRGLQITIGREDLATPAATRTPEKPTPVATPVPPLPPTPPSPNAGRVGIDFLDSPSRAVESLGGSLPNPADRLLVDLIGWGIVGVGIAYLIGRLRAWHII